MNNCIYVAEAGINHSGSLDTALQLIDLAKKHGFDYVKFQKRNVDLCYTQEYLDGLRDSPWGKTQRDQKLGLELSIDDYRRIDNYCDDIGIKWFYSAWDIYSAKEMREFDVDFIKIAKASINNKELIEYYNSFNSNLVVSMNYNDPSNENHILYDFNKNVIRYILSCVSLYPSPTNFNGLEHIQTIKSRYHKPAGYSNHSSNWIHPVIASYLGAEMIECHITLDKNMYGSDQKASLDDDDLTNMMKYRYDFPSEEDIDKYMLQENEVLKKLRQTW